MNRTICNPMNLDYKYSLSKKKNKVLVFREAADPTLVHFNGKYFLFASMSKGFWFSSDLINWMFHENNVLPIYDYAPDVQVVGDYLVYSASRASKKNDFYRTKDPLSDQWELFSTSIGFWDPHTFKDDDGRIFFYWGCSNKTPIYGVEMNPETMQPISEKAELIFGRPDYIGYDRRGENGKFVKEKGLLGLLLKDAPFIEGAYMNKHRGKYYLQYSAPGTEFNTYSDGVYTSINPLGPFNLQKSNPFSSKPGGFITAAGHGSTIQDEFGNWWHISTMRISKNFMFERRLGLWPAGFDEDGTMFCNQSFGDYPYEVPSGKFDPKSVKPKWMLLSYKKKTAVSSFVKNYESEKAVNEDIRDFWKSRGNQKGEWLSVDLGEICDVYAIQINMHDDGENNADIRNTKLTGPFYMKRTIQNQTDSLRYDVLSSLDGVEWFNFIEQSDKSKKPHELLCIETGRKARFIKVIFEHAPYDQAFAVSGLRIFGLGNGNNPSQVEIIEAKYTGSMNALIKWTKSDQAIGYNVLYGNTPDKLYHSWMVYDQTELDLSTLINGCEYYVRVDSFCEVGVTEGKVKLITSK